MTLSQVLHLTPEHFPSISTTFLAKVPALFTDDYVPVTYLSVGHIDHLMICVVTLAAEHSMTA